MNLNAVLAFVAASFSGALGLAVMLRNRRSVASWCFSIGMLLFAIESALTGISFEAVSAERVAFWQTLTLAAKSLLPGIWLCFSLTYSRANYREFLTRSRLLLVAFFLIPLSVLPAFHAPFIEVLPYELPAEGWAVNFGEPAKILNALILIATVLILMNLERTFRSAIGTMRWRIKFLVLGLVVVFGARIYTRSQALLFSGYNLAQLNIETAGLLIGCALVAIGYLRSGFGEIDIYPSRAVLRTSLTLLLAGGYLFIVGVLAQIVAHFGGAKAFPVEAFLILLGVVILAVLLFSERLRQSLQLFISRHFKRPQHDFRQIWTRFTGAMPSVLDEPGLCMAVSGLISEIFSALSVSVWLFDEPKERLIRTSSTSDSGREQTGNGTAEIAANALNSVGLTKLARPFDLEKAKEKWTETLKEIGAGRFRTGGNRVCIPLLAGEHWLGVIILADRVNGLRYTVEEMDLLKCIGDQVAASLLNLRLIKKLVLGKELEAFQTISAFFIHDLKNAASTLSLMLQNLPLHFNDASFRADALHGIGSTVDRINHLISRLSELRRGLPLEPTEVDLNHLVGEALQNLNGAAEQPELVTKFAHLPKIVADREQLRSVVTNLLLNARDAVGTNGRITVETKELGEWVTLSVSDNGCGMAAAFVKDSLFRPFRTTKKKGLGIGMFQAKMIVEAHRGTIRVQSEVGLGTTFHVTLPVKSHSK